MADAWLMNAYEQSMEDDPDFWSRPEVLAELDEANRRHAELYGDLVDDDPF